MLLSFLGLGRKHHASSLRQWSSHDLCDQLDEPGSGVHTLTYVDFSERRTTKDQQRIEAVLAQRDLRGSRLLHVGIGDSGLARRFHERCRAIDGLTVSEREHEQATAHGLPNYRVLLLNKYGRDFPLKLQPGYDCIIDNNLASFACCGFHFARMLDHYRWALAPAGQILTDEQGMGWVVHDKRWRMTFEDLAELGKRFQLRVLRLTDTVYALERQ